MDVHAIRRESLEQLTVLGFPKPPEHFPILDRVETRPEEDVVNRALVLHVVINVAFNMPTDLARIWLDHQGLSQSMTEGENGFLESVDGGMAPDAQGHQLQVEALWALVWALGHVPTLDFNEYCGESLSSYLPDLRASESRDRFDTTSSLHDATEVFQVLDLAYCITWGIADANLTRRNPSGKLDQYAYWERRRSLEWLFGDEWDEPDLST